MKFSTIYLTLLCTGVYTAAVTKQGLVGLEAENVGASSDSASNVSSAQSTLGKIPLIIIMSQNLTLLDELTGTASCPVGYPYYCAAENFCCPSGYPWCCSFGCCPSGYPYCGRDGRCHSR